MWQRLVPFQRSLMVSPSNHEAGMLRGSPSSFDKLRTRANEGAAKPLEPQ
jgi:hypothetical protein